MQCSNICPGECCGKWYGERSGSFVAGAGALKSQVGITYLDPASSSLAELDEALARLDTLEGALKRIIVEASAVTVAVDGLFATTGG